MKILIIEDKEMHRKSAEVTLASHDVTIVDSFDKAKDQMNLIGVKGSQRTFPYEVVLTDMMMPMCQSVLTQNFNPVEQVPYGFVIALKATLCGAKFVAMVTDTNHHKGAMSAALDSLGDSYYRDCFKPNFTINGAKVMFVHAPFVQKVTRDVPCNWCEENPGVCSRCDGTGLEKTRMRGRENVTAAVAPTPSENALAVKARDDTIAWTKPKPRTGVKFSRI